MAARAAASLLNALYVATPSPCEARRKTDAFRSLTCEHPPYCHGRCHGARSVPARAGADRPPFRPARCAGRHRAIRAHHRHHHRQPRTDAAHEVAGFGRRDQRRGHPADRPHAPAADHRPGAGRGRGGDQRRRPHHGHPPALHHQPGLPLPGRRHPDPRHRLLQPQRPVRDQHPAGRRHRGRQGAGLGALRFGRHCRHRERAVACAVGQTGCLGHR